MSQVDNRQRGGGRTSSSQNEGRRNTQGTSRRTGQSYRQNSSYQPRRGKKRRRGPQYGVTKVLLGIIIAVASVMGVMAAVKVVGQKTKDTEVISSTVSETELKKDVKVDDISITGMSREEAREAIEKSIRGR